MKKVISLRDLPRELMPPRDLWPQLESRLRAGVLEHRAPLDRLPTPLRRLAAEIRQCLVSLRPLFSVLRPFAAVAALAAAVGAGIAIGRALLPVVSVPASLAARASTPEILPAYLADPSYMREREVLLRSLNARLSELPPQTRQKVLASLATIDRSMREIEAAMGTEPGNALLQELLVDTYQDEMRVLTTVQEASTGGEI